MNDHDFSFCFKINYRNSKHFPKVKLNPSVTVNDEPAEVCPYFYSIRIMPKRLTSVSRSGLQNEQEVQEIVHFCSELGRV